MIWWTARSVLGNVTVCHSAIVRCWHQHQKFQADSDEYEIIWIETMWSLQLHVGRLIELRIWAPVKVDELDLFGKELMALTGQVLARGQRAVICHDLRELGILAPDVSDWFVRMMERDNPRIERVGILIGQGATHALQIERMIKQAKNATRRIFRDDLSVIAWLSDVLDSAEVAALRQFFGARQ
jgi:hypothetical protein